MFRFYHYKNTLYLNTMFVFRDFFAFIAQYLSLEATYYLFFMSKIVLFGKLFLFRLSLQKTCGK